MNVKKLTRVNGQPLSRQPKRRKLIREDKENKVSSYNTYKKIRLDIDEDKQDVHKAKAERKSLFSLDKRYLDDPQRAPLYCKEIFVNLQKKEVR